MPHDLTRVIDSVLATLQAGDGVDYVANNFDPASFPKGLDLEAFTRRALEIAWREDERPEWREHVTPFIRRHPERFTHADVRCAEDASELRWTVDTPADLALIRRLVSAAPPDATWEALAAIQRAHPEWATLNEHVEQRTVPS